MLLNDKLYNIGRDSKEVCTIIDDNYVLVTKMMPVTNDKLEEYINNINVAFNNGINIARILDYRLITGTTREYLNGTVKYTMGVFLEERAKGVSLEQEITYVNKDNIKDGVLKYQRDLREYIEELDNRAQAPQEMYNKLVSDCLMISKYGIDIDPKPLNFFFDKDKGFTIIDVIGGKVGKDSIISPYFSQYIFSIVYGYGRPYIIVNNNVFKGLSLEYRNRLIDIYKKIDYKIIYALKKYKICEDDIKVTLEKENNKYTNLDDVIEFSCIEEILSNYSSSKQLCITI